MAVIIRYKTTAPGAALSDSQIQLSIDRAIFSEDGMLAPRRIDQDHDLILEERPADKLD